MMSKRAAAMRRERARVDRWGIVLGLEEGAVVVFVGRMG